MLRPNENPFYNEMSIDPEQYRSAAEIALAVIFSNEKADRSNDEFLELQANMDKNISEINKKTVMEILSMKEFRDFFDELEERSGVSVGDIFDPNKQDEKEMWDSQIVSKVIRDKLKNQQFKTSSDYTKELMTAYFYEAMERNGMENVDLSN